MSQSNKKQAKIYPVILSGGVGSRLWPESRALYPKQFMSFGSPLTLLQQTADRMKADGFATPMVICNAEHRFIIAQQLMNIGITEPTIMLEPMGRNTAPAIAAAAIAVHAEDPDGVILVLPSDHHIEDVDGFISAARETAEAAHGGAFATFGIVPDHPNTGYGYIRSGAHPQAGKPWMAVDAFKEKPDADLAAQYLAQGGYYWNSGMFLFPVAPLLEELKTYEPLLVEQAAAAVGSATRDLDFINLEKAAFEKCPSLPIDTAVMERTKRAVVTPLSVGWSDLGSWDALWDIADKDAQGNASIGDVITLDSKSNFLQSKGKLLATLGVEDLVVVCTDDAVLVAHRDHAQSVKSIVDSLAEADRNEAISHKLCYRPWGNYRTLDLGDRFQVKQIVVNPGGVLSLQMHHHRAEHWIVVEGTAKVTRGEETFLLSENQSTYIPLGTKHRLENPGQVPLRLIEVQSGNYLGEDDIKRFEDVYGRDKQDNTD